MVTIANRSITFYLYSVIFTLFGIIQAMEPQQNLNKIPLKDHFIGMLQCGPNSLLVYGENTNTTGYLDQYDFSGIKEKSYDLNDLIVTKIFPLSDSEMMLIYLDKNKIKKLNLTLGKICDMYYIPTYDNSEPLSWYLMLTNGRIVFGYLNNYIKICNVQTGAIIKEFALDPNSLFQITDGQNRIFQLTGSETQKLLTWDLEKSECSNEIEIPSLSDNTSVSSSCYLDAEHIVFGWDNGYVSVWDLTTHEKIKEFQAHDNRIGSIIAIGNGCFVTGCKDGLIKTWAIGSDECLHSFKGHTADKFKGIVELIQLPCGQIASASRSSIQISKASTANNTEII